MSRLGIFFTVAMTVFSLSLPLPATAAGNGRSALLLHVDGAISPAMADYIVHGLTAAKDHHAELVILEMDTPGGLSSSMRTIIKAILASPVPVVSFVAPSGSRAASAGTYIMYASHIAAMAPATNLGAATPVQLGGTTATPAKPKTAEERKILNDAVAYIHGLALKHGRNAIWAEQAVRKGASLTATEALQQHVIDLMANNVADLLAKLDGRKVSTEAGMVTLHTVGITVQDFPRGFRVDFLMALTNPTVAYILLLLGIFGLIFEGYNPGGVWPGVVGVISLLLALYAFNILPVNFAGLALIVLGILLFVTETFVPAYGTLSMGGLVAFVIGSIVLMDTGVPGYGVSRGLIGGISVSAALLILVTLWLAVRSQRRPVVSGAEELLEDTGRALSDFSADGSGTVHIHSETWNAHSKTPIHAGDSIKVIRREGLQLIVKPVQSSNKEDT